ncbi:MAG: type II toxin-antitoxin system HicB family antitoxin [Ruminococcus sp.]|nr:type II toxin-antitoxin system HicB family antitoxin [Ruminococcus sp.]
MKLSYPVCIYPNSPNDGFTAIVPDLPGCVTCGDTIQEVFEMAVDAVSGWVLTELEDGNTPPISSEITAIHADEYPNGFTSMLILDMDAYAEKYGEKAVRKNCTIPAWLNTQAELSGINFSQVLQEALLQKLHVE